MIAKYHINPSDAWNMTMREYTAIVQVDKAKGFRQEYEGGKDKDTMLEHFELMELMKHG